MAKRESFTANDPHALFKARARLPEHYDMSLNQSDMGLLLTLLYTGAYEMTGDDEFSDRVQSFYSSVLETLDVELI